MQYINQRHCFGAITIAKPFEISLVNTAVNYKICYVLAGTAAVAEELKTNKFGKSNSPSLYKPGWVLASILEVLPIC
jgi:hypothetical protein